MIMNMINTKVEKKDNIKKLAAKKTKATKLKTKETKVKKVSKK